MSSLRFQQLPSWSLRQYLHSQPNELDTEVGGDEVGSLEYRLPRTEFRHQLPPEVVEAACDEQWCSHDRVRAKTHGTQDVEVAFHAARLGGKRG